MICSTTAVDDHPTIYYAIGNDKSADITQGLRIQDESNLLFLGCGDIRNVLHTVHGLCQRDLSKVHQVHIYLNDIEDGILARDFLLLYLVRTLDPREERDMLFLWAVWYDVILSQDHYRRLKESLQELLSKCELNDVSFGNETTRARIKTALKSWSNSSLSAQEIREKRAEFFQKLYRFNFLGPPSERVSGKIIHQHFKFAKCPHLKPKYQEEVQEYFTHGQTRVTRGRLPFSENLETFGANMTFMRPGSDTWAVEDNSCPYMCYDPGMEIEKYDGETVSMSSLFLKTLQQWVMSFQTAAKHRLSVQISFWLGEATAVVKNDLPKDLRFDFIDTSNIADRVGLVTILVYCSGILRKESGVLYTESFKWHHKADDVGIFLRRCMDISPLMYPTVLGLHLAEELTLGHEKGVNQGCFVGFRKLSLRWRAAHEQRNLSRSADKKSDAVSSAMGVLEKMSQIRHDSSKTDDVYKCEEEALSKLQTRLRDLLASAEKHPKRNYTVEEMTTLYKVTLNADLDELTDSWSLQEDKNNPGSVVVVNNIKGSSEVRFREIIHFSCDVRMKKSRIVSSPQTGTVDGTFYKDRDSTVGERVLPWKLISTEDITHYRNCPQTELALGNIKTDVTRMFPVDERELQPGDPPVGLVLMKVILFFMNTAPELYGVPVVISTSLSDRQRYVLEGWKVFEDKPATFVTWYDLELGQRLVREGKVNWMEFLNMAIVPSYNNDTMDSSSGKEAVKLLKRILLLNSDRLTQDLPPELRWKTRSFVRARYPYKDFDTLRMDLQRKYGLLGREADLLSGMPDQVQTIFRCTGLPESRHQVEGTNRCAVCGRSDDVRRCSKCLRVAYCSKECQRKHWSSHKKHCQRQ